ncbi:hypothetical protein [Streptomyces alanosinicus]|uniref:Uncharacterized protein n=1 Tax=Streptomyces alanosinicus TaxID=68171 RepID=A0A919D6B6_9ACTN|nr:hypothetical protein [Streptomyces alanosinicus]GHE10344.1 hypothetical protein GCM10010339_66150 [Streptomyces alanosinicus]
MRHVPKDELPQRSFQKTECHLVSKWGVMQQLPDFPFASDGAFNIAAWREIVTRAAASTDPRIQAICPFGFEVTNDARFIRRNLNRFYVYLGIPPNLNPSAAWSVAFAEHLGKIVSECAPDYWGAAHCSPENERLPLGHGYRSVDIRSIPASGDLLEMYAQFICTVPIAIADEICIKPGMFDSEGTCRYFYQLSVMFHHLHFGPCAALSPKEMDVLGRLMREISTREQETGKTAELSSTSEQRAAVHRIVIPQTGRIRDHIQRLATGPNKVTVRTQDINTPLTWDATLPFPFLNANMTAVLHAYRTFGHHL